jgi:uncharacterized protein YgiM (DUF1202 family)
MIYACKIIVKEDEWNDNLFLDIYIKYKPQNSIGFYKKYFILKEYEYSKDAKTQLADLFENIPTRLDKLKWFNTLSMEDIKSMVTDYIKKNQKEKSEKELKEEELQQQIKSAKEKANKFTVEI